MPPNPRPHQRGNQWIGVNRCLSKVMVEKMIEINYYYDYIIIIYNMASPSESFKFTYHICWKWFIVKESQPL
jgi:hypothetical protein